MRGGAWENVRYIPTDNGIQTARQGMAVGAARYTNATRSIPVYDIRYTNTVYNRHHQSFATPGCVYRVCACVRACVRYIIILL